MISIGKKPPKLTLPATGDKKLSLQDFKGTNLVLFFYPKASTPGCTQESRDFAERYQAFRKAGAEVLGASRDGIKAQENFKAKQDLPFDLLSDTDEALCKVFDVIREKNMYGRKVLGIERSTFLVDREGKLRHEWRKVRVKGHAEEVLEAVKSLSA